MKSTKIDSSVEAQVLVAMVLDKTVLGRVAVKWGSGDLFDVRWANIVARWCVQYYARYKDVPAKNLRGLFEAWATKHRDDDDLVELVGRFCAALPDASEPINADYMTDLAGRHFNEVALRRLADVVRGHVDTGSTDKALEAVAKHGKIELGVGAGVDVLTDEAALERAFEQKSEPLITYTDALGEFIGDQLGRDEFVAVTGPTGRGKTWWLIEFAWQAVRQGRRVAFFEVGDMSEAQVLRRFACRATGHPLRAGANGYSFDVPTAIRRSAGESVAAVDTEVKKFAGPPQWAKARDEFRAFTRRHKAPLLKLSTHPNSSINVAGLVGVLDVWERAGWIADVVVVDYADLLTAPAGYDQGDREAINATWKELRGLSQRRHCLVLTATQANAASYGAVTLTRSNFSDDRRKNDHVTAMLGLNQTEEEKQCGITRLNWTKRREEFFTELRCVHVAGCLSIGRPAIKSTF